MAQEVLKDIKGPVYFPANQTLLIILVLLIVSAGLGVLIFSLVKKFRRKRKEPPFAPKPAHQIAYEALEALRAKNLPAAGKIKEYYYLLSDIVRRYIENRFDIRAPEMTTEEFLFSLRGSGHLDGAHKNLLKEFLNLADFVKFAKYGPTQAEIESSLEAAKHLVDETKEAEEPQEARGAR